MSRIREIQPKKDPRAEDDEAPLGPTPAAPGRAGAPLRPPAPKPPTPAASPAAAPRAAPPLRPPGPVAAPGLRPPSGAAAARPPTPAPARAPALSPLAPKPASSAAKPAPSDFDLELPPVPAASAPRTELEQGARESDPSPRRSSAPHPEGRTSDPSAKLGDPFHIVGTTQAGTFKVEKVVAHGGFGVIYRAKHVGFRAPVALKCLKIPETLDGAEREQFLERFRSEGEVMFRLSTSIPEVVRPLQVDFMKLAKGTVVPFIALEWLEGETLKDLIVRRLEANKPPIRIERAIPYLAPVARALARAHRFPGPDGQPLAIVHCDLKPDNIFVVRMDGADSFKIFDFGIAKVRLAASREAGGLTRGGASMFTPAYAAPEQWAPDRFGQTGPWTDVYAFALTVTELLTQRPAIDGSPASMLRQALDEDHRPTPRKLGLAIPEAVDDVFRRALSVSPKTRTQTIEAFWTELEDALQLPQTFSGRLSVAAMPAVRVQLDDDEAPPAPGRPRSSPTPKAAAAPSFDLGELPTPGSAPGAAPASAPPSLLDQALVAGSPAAAPAAAPAPTPFPTHAEPPPAPMAPPLAPSGAPTFGPPPSAQAAPAPAPPDATEPVAPGGARGPLDSDALGGGALALEVDRPAAPPAAPAPVLATGPGGLPIAAGPGGAALSPQGPASVPGMPPGPASGPGMPPGPGALPSTGSAQDEVPAAPVGLKLGAAAAKAGGVAAKAGGVAAEAAKSLAKKALEVDERHRIQLDKPETWLKPMMLPLVLMGAAIVITIGAIIANRFLEDQIKVSWISAPLIVLSVAFAVYRWIKLQDDQDD